MTIKKIQPLPDGDEKLNMLPKYCGKHFLTVENGIYNCAGKWDENYNGGQWEYVDLDGCFFAYPSEERDYTASTAFDFETTNNITFGMAASQIIVNQMSWHLYEKGDTEGSKMFADQYHLLRDKMFTETLGEAWKELGLDIAKIVRITD